MVFTYDQRLCFDYEGDYNMLEDMKNLKFTQGLSDDNIPTFKFFKFNKRQQDETNNNKVFLTMSDISLKIEN